MGGPDYIYDPDDWHTTYEWSDRDELVGGWGGELGAPKKFCTLIEGPPKWAKEVILSRDENGDPDEIEMRWFDSLEEALAADCPKATP